MEADWSHEGDVREILIETRRFLRVKLWVEKLRVFNKLTKAPARAANKDQ